MQLLDLFTVFKVQKIKKIYKEDMNKGTIWSFCCLKIFLLHKCRFKTLITFFSFFYRAMIIWTHVNTFYDTTFQFLIKPILLWPHCSSTPAAFYPACLSKLLLELLFFKLPKWWMQCWEACKSFTFSCGWEWGKIVCIFLNTIHNG